MKVYDELRLIGACHKVSYPTIKKWFLETFLPMWAKETVLRDNRNLRAENEALRQKVRELDSYIQGLHMGLRGRRKA